jgi:hypothetical protein
MKYSVQRWSWQRVALIAVACFTHPATAQSPAEQQALSRSCVAISIDQCYRDGLIRLINNNFLPQIAPVLTSGQRSTLQSVKFFVVQDRDALGASAGYIDGSAVVRITSSVGYHIALFANAAAQNLLSGTDLSSYAQYQEKVVAVLVENTRRTRLGRTLLPTPSYADAVGLDDARASEFMNDPTALGMSAYFTQTITFWVLAHEAGHQILGHARAIAQSPGVPHRPMEIAADDFASRTLVKMGYSVYPTILLMGYFSAIEESNGGATDAYPPSVCRLANVFNAAWSERQRSGSGPRDEVNTQWNAIMDQPALRDKMAAISHNFECRN